MGVLERKSGIFERTWRTLALLCLLLASTACLAADKVSPIQGSWREARPGDTPAQVLAEAQAGQLHDFDPGRMQVFPTDAAGAWVVLRAAPPWIAEDRVLSIHTPSLGRVGLYDDKGRVQSAALEDFDAPFHGHGRLIFPLKAERSPTAPILLKFEPSPTLSGPVTFGLQNWPDFLRDDARWLVFATTCLAVMLAMAAMSICFALMLRDMTFAWYTGYLVCYALIQGIQTGYLFHPMEWASLSGFASGLGAAAVAVSVSFAALFLIRFADLSRYAPLLRTPVMALAVGMPLIVLLRISGIDLLAHTAQTLLNPILILGALLVLVATLFAAFSGSRHAWFFLAGWTPLLALTALCSAQMNGVLADAPWLPDMALAAGAFEAIVLSIGLADRALTIRRDRDHALVLADNDALTGVLNRRAWSEAARTMLESDDEKPLALLFLDLDYFKELNDCQGHAAGDRALVAVAGALRTELRPADVLGRYGGEEFIAMLDGVDQENAMHVATRLCRRVHRLELSVGPRGPLTISIGLAMRMPGDNLETLVERADAAMYAAKLGGRNRVMLESRQVPVAEPPISLRRVSDISKIRSSTERHS
jgi:diguanylate cyclase (GGDEF)-like protein